MKTLFLLSSLFFFSSVTLFAEHVATVSALKGKADIEHNETTLAATIGSKLQKKDTIKTHNNSKLQMIFLDETVITVGKNSIFSIKEYLFEDAKEPVAEFGMLKGAIRTITGGIGKIAPQKFRIVTKTATIGIRGTNFTTTVEENGMVKVFCTYGAININSNGINTIVRQGHYGIVSPDGSVEVKAFSPAELKKLRDEYFGSTTYKNASIIQATDLMKQNENDTQLNVTINDDSGIIIQEIKELNNDIILNPGENITSSDIIAQYTMESATYLGSYTTQVNTGTLPTNGDTKLSINFATDTALLELGDFNNLEPTTSYEFINVNTNAISGTQFNGPGSATGTFYEATGTLVKGTFTYGESSEISTEGSYSAKTFQALH